MSSGRIRTRSAAARDLPASAVHARRRTEPCSRPTVTELRPAPRDDGRAGAAELAAGGPDRTSASLGLHRYARPACFPITVPWFLDRPVPRLPVTDVPDDRTAGRRPYTSPPSPAPGPGGAPPAAVVVTGGEAPRDQVRTAVAEHLEPVLGGFGPRMRRPRAVAVGHGATDEIVTWDDDRISELTAAAAA